MHRSVVWVVLLLLTSIIPASGQDASEVQLGVYSLLGADAEDDNDVTIEGEQYEESPFDPIDFIGLHIMEEEHAFRLRLDVAGLHHQDSVWTGNGNEELDRAYYYYDVVFKGLDQMFDIGMYYYEAADGTQTVDAYMGSYNDDYGYEYNGDIVVELDDSNNAFVLHIPRDYILDAEGRRASPGDVLSEFWIQGEAHGQVQSLSFGSVESEDRLPDSGVLTSTWSVIHGVASSGHILAGSEHPVRVSNGEATTFLYEVDVTNDGDFLDSVLPSWTGGQEGWIITFPDAKVRLEPGETKTIPFLVSVPFAHKHGTYHPFTVTFQSQADPLAAGLVELGVRYTAIPQPAGHHPEVYLHELDNGMFFNTIEGDDFPEGTSEQEQAELDEYYYTRDCGGPGDSYGAGYVFPLTPHLEMGLDFDLDRLGEATIMSTSAQGAEGIWYEGYVIVTVDDYVSPCSIRYDVPEGAVARIEPSEPVSVPADSTVASTSAITPYASGDYISYQDGLQMYFGVIQHRDELAPNDVNCCLADDFEATIVADGTKLFLPLSEYHDDVDEFFNRLTGLDLYATSGQERYVNPSETVLFRLTAQNIGAIRAEFDLELVGNNAAWAGILGDVDHIRLDPGESKELVVAVHAPSSAVDEEMADVTLVMSSQEDESIRSLIRLLAEVDTDTDHADEAVDAAVLDDELQEAPTLALPTALAVLAVVAVLTRRRTH